MGELFLKVFGLDQGADLEVSSREPHEPLDFESSFDLGDAQLENLHVLTADGQFEAYEVALLSP